MFDCITYEGPRGMRASVIHRVENKCIDWKTDYLSYFNVWTACEWPNYVCKIKSHCFNYSGSNIN